MPSARRKPAPSPDTVLITLRSGTNYDRMSGYAPFFRAWLAELPRLCPGASCWALVMTVASESLGRPRDKGEPMPEWTGDLDRDWLASVCRTDRRTVDRDLKYLESSGMAQMRHTIRGAVGVRLCFRDWPNLPDYKPSDRPDPSGEPSPPKETFELVKAPRRVKAGEFSDPIKVSCPVSSFRFQAGGSVDMAFTAVVKGGEFLVCSREQKGEEKAYQGNSTQPNGINTKPSNSRHERRDLQPKSEKSEVKAKGEVKAKNPRADELARLFDPILLRSCQRSLSADQVAFDQALTALGDLPHDFLVKFVIQRAERPISSPKVCASILKEARANWEKVKNLPDAERIPPQSHKKRLGFVEDVMQEAERRLKKYGRL